MFRPGNWSEASECALVGLASRRLRQPALLFQTPSRRRPLEFMITNRRRSSTSTFKACPPPDKPVFTWQIERARRLHRKFLSIEAAQRRGEGFKAATKFFVWYWRARAYQADPARRVHFSRGTLYSLFRKWRDGGRSPDALRLHYTGGRQALSV